MREARGDLTKVSCDALVVTTNGFVKANGECVMGRGIAKQMADEFPVLPFFLGDSLTKFGNMVFCFDRITPRKAIVTFPVKPYSYPNNGHNVVEHMKHKFQVGQQVPGWAIKAQIHLIESSLEQLVELTDSRGWTNVVCPRFGCGAGELDWNQVKVIAEKYLDDRFTVYTF